MKMEDRMKQKALIFLFIMMVAAASLSAVSQDYINGYLAGYADGKSGIAAEYAQAENKTAETSLYKIKYFVDEFGDPTDEGYISQITPAEGTFSNSATRNSDMLWYFIIAPQETAFIIYEYGWSLVSGASAYPTDYEISIKTADGTVYSYRAKNYSDRISINPNEEASFINLLCSNSSVRIVIKEISDYSNASYNLGTVDCTDLAELYAELTKS